MRIQWIQLWDIPRLKYSKPIQGIRTIVLPWGSMNTEQLPMGLSNSPSIFPGKMSELTVRLALPELKVTIYYGVLRVEVFQRRLCDTNYSH
jgi:hypothetical protein